MGVRRAELEASKAALDEAASTGPHSWECGEQIKFVAPAVPKDELQRGRTRGSAESINRLEHTTFGLALCFNGAALVGVRRDNTSADWYPSPIDCFNGAALVGVRRVGWAASKIASEGLLQRGRTRGSAESRRAAVGLAQQVQASTGPHSWECGEFALKPMTPQEAEASTGPHSWECGELAALAGAHVAAVASTGPHSWECGERWEI